MDVLVGAQAAQVAALVEGQAGVVLDRESLMQMAVLPPLASSGPLVAHVRPSVRFPVCCARAHGIS